MLAIVTTLELDPKSQNRNYVPFAEKLSRAARDYLADSEEAAAFVLMNRPQGLKCPVNLRREERDAAPETSGRGLRAIPVRSEFAPVA